MNAVAEVMTPSVLTVAPDTPAAAAQRIARKEGVHRLAVLEDGHLVGVVCLSDLAEADAGELVGHRMHRSVRCIAPSASISDAVEAMVEHAIGCLIVLDGDMLVGIVTRGDLRHVGYSGAAARAMCACCHATEHVRCDERWGGVPYCRDCLERALPPELGEDLGEGD